jgi:hypothetical protein
LNPVFIVGCGRSGTTILRLMLNQHSMIAIPEETWYFPRLLQMLPALIKHDDWKAKVANKIFELNTIHFPDISKSQLMEALIGIQRNDYASIISCLNRSFAASEGKIIWGDKTPGYVLSLATIKKIFPNARVIHMIRDGRDVVESLLKNWKVGPQTNDFKKTVEYWKKHVTVGIKEGPLYFGENYIEVRYEELVSEPNRVLNEICDFLMIPMQQSMLNFSQSAGEYTPNWKHHTNTNKPLNTASVFKWKDEYDNRKGYLFSLLAGKLLLKLDYENRPKIDLYAFNEFLLYKLKTTMTKWTLQLKIYVHRLISRWTIK